jgi:hypothetical protein
MRELRRVIDTSHRLGMKAVPYVSLKEFHPESPDFPDNFRRWQRMETAAGELTHTWTGSGEYGALMCMKSGWLDFRKKACEVMLSDLPWDGLYFDWCTFHHCRNRLHEPGEWHTDVEEFLDFVLWARRRVGPRGFLFVHLSGVPSFVCENAADLVTIGELDGVFGPDSWSPEYRLVPVTQKMSAMWSVSGRQRTLLVYSGMLQGHPSALAAPVTAEQEELLAQIELFRGEELSSYSFARSSDRPVATGREGVWACLWWKRARALVYAANLTDAAASGRLTVDLAGRGLRARSFRWERIEPPQAAQGARRRGASPEPRSRGEGRIGSAELAASGLEYALRPWSAALYALRAAR